MILAGNRFVDKWFASGLEVGSISALTYSMVIVNFGIQAFSASLIVVMFTKMSELISSNSIHECDEYIRSNIIRLANIVVPVSAVIYFSSFEIIQVLFQRGAFDENATFVASGTMAMYILGLPALVINLLVARIFHSIQKLREKIWLAVQFLVTNVLGNILLVKSLGTVGLAISSTAAINIHLFLSFVVLARYHHGFRIKTYVAIIFRAYSMAAVALVVATYSGVDNWLLELVGEMPQLLSSLFVAIGKSLFVFSLYGIQLAAWFKFKKR